MNTKYLDVIKAPVVTEKAAYLGIFSLAVVFPVLISVIVPLRSGGAVSHYRQYQRSRNSGGVHRGNEYMNRSESFFHQIHRLIYPSCGPDHRDG